MIVFIYHWHIEGFFVKKDWEVTASHPYLFRDHVSRDYPIPDTATDTERRIKGIRLSGIFICTQWSLMDQNVALSTSFPCSRKGRKFKGVGDHEGDW
jgi:hypothetical protein